LRSARIFPSYLPRTPRTRKRIADFGLHADQLQILDPLSYLEFLGMQSRATVVITDSGGIQEETTYLGVPCLTLRENTERPVTVSLGANVLVGRDPDKLRSELSRVFAGKAKKGTIPPLWDGHSGERIAAVLADQQPGTILARTGAARFTICKPQSGKRGRHGPRA
jgi:UDP-N-acetylglucosamine 2-epimerase (non-hydrolysing)